MKRNRALRTIPLILGILLILGALGLTVYNLWDQNRAYRTAEDTVELIHQLRQRPELEEEPTGEVSPLPTEAPTEEPAEESEPPQESELPEEMPTAQINGADYIGTLYIPALGLELPVMAQWSYPNLRISPCRYEGTAYEDGFVIAAHNYPRHFGRLKELSIGDELRFEDMDGNVITYTVGAITKVDPTNYESLHVSDWGITLFTCTIGGKQRVVVQGTRTETLR